MQYSITIKNEKIKSYRTIALIILILNLAAFVFLLYYDKYRYEASSAILLTGIYIFMRLYFVQKYAQGHYLDQVLLFVLAGCWFGMQNYLMVAVLAVLGILYHLALQKLIFVFTPEKISKTNFPVREIEWNSLSNVVLKDNILTLDFKNNRLFQAEIDKKQQVNENQFNAFARERLSAN